MVLEEAGYWNALLGLSLNKKQLLEKMPEVAEKLCGKDGGHNKFLESIQVWLDITAPRFFWQEFDTYRIGTTKQSESTMHTILKDGDIHNGLFDSNIDQNHLDMCNHLIDTQDLVGIKQQLPEGFLQRRIVCLNYKVLRHIYAQRRNHRLPHWIHFTKSVLEQLEHPLFITKRQKGENIFELLGVPDNCTIHELEEAFWQKVHPIYNI
jgi:hypothetical protein